MMHTSLLLVWVKDNYIYYYFFYQWDSTQQFHRIFLFTPHKRGPCPWTAGIESPHRTSEVERSRVSMFQITSKHKIYY